MFVFCGVLVTHGKDTEERYPIGMFWPPLDDLLCGLDVETEQPLVEDLGISQIGSRRRIVIASEIIGPGVIFKVFADLVFELYWRDHTGISGEVELEAVLPHRIDGVRIDGGGLDLELIRYVPLDATSPSACRPICPSAVGI